MDAAVEPGEVDEGIFVSSPTRMLRVSKELKKLHFSNPGEKMKGTRAARRHRGSSGPVASQTLSREEGKAGSHDVCDCLSTSCPGCFLPCPKCRSNKCSVVCRAGRMWDYVKEVPGDYSQ